MPESEHDNMDTGTPLSARIESVLFMNGEPLSLKRLSKILGTGEDEIRNAMATIRSRHETKESGIALIENGDSFELVTRPENASLVETFVASDREESLGKATLEVLSVVAYRSPVTRSEIDAIRGVNSSFALRNLLLRGLIEREQNPLDSREYRYSPSFRLLELLGIGSLSELPDHASLSSDGRVTGLIAESPKDDPEATKEEE
ncbi:MAG: SMC-Scp complex subunit ScpB [Candidatus Moranbacteria bacterium]|nr:SMC-Scp complex subunit ScpB [Candidatus Moranbacteria bacterium]